MIAAADVLAVYPRAPSAPKSYSIAITAGLLDVSVPSVHGLIRQGRIRAIKITPRNFRIEETELVRFLRSVGYQGSLYQEFGQVKDE